VMYRDGKGVTQDPVEAVRLFTLSANQGCANAQYNLGWMYQTGTGVTQDKIQATRLYVLAANQGQVNAKEALKSVQ